MYGLKLNVKLYLCELLRTMNERMVSEKLMVVLESWSIQYFLFV